jgi:hypothetical protein
MECLVSRIEKGLDDIVAGSGVAEQRNARQCFQSGGCGTVSFAEKDVLDAFLPCTSSDVKNDCQFRYAVEKVFDMLRAVTKDAPEVATCMVEYFKEIGQDKLTDCVRDYPPPGGMTPPFTQSRIPGFDELDMDKITQVITYNLMTRYTLLKCRGCSNRNNDDLINCLVQNVNDDDEEVCNSRRNCENGIGVGCQGRYQKVRNSICTCAREEFQKGLDAINNWQDIKKMLAGGLERQFKECYHVRYPNGKCYAGKWPAMYAKSREVKSAVIKAYLAYTKGQVPGSLEDILHVVTSVINELTSKWAGIFCGECDGSAQSNSQLAAATLKKMVENKAKQGCGPATARPGSPVRESSFGERVESHVNDNVRDAINNFFGGK